MALLVFGVGLPVESAVGVGAALLGNAGEDGNRLGPAAAVDGTHSIGIRAVVGRTLNAGGNVQVEGGFGGNQVFSGCRLRTRSQGRREDGGCEKENDS